MVEYYECDSSLMCAVNINNLKLKNTELRINYSKYKTIDLEKNNKNKNSINFNEVFVPAHEDHRFKPNDQKRNLSKVLMVQITYDQELDIEIVKDFLKELMNAKEVALMVENRDAKRLEMRVTFDETQ